MTVIDFSHWAVIALFTGWALKCVVSDILTKLNRRYETNHSGRDAYDAAIARAPSVGRMFPFEKFKDAYAYSLGQRGFSDICRWTGRVWFAVTTGFCLTPCIAEWIWSSGFAFGQPLLAVWLTTAVMSLFVNAVNAPFDLYDTFSIEKKFGFNRQTLGGWISDFVKSYLVGIAMSGASLSLIYAGTRLVCRLGLPLAHPLTIMAAVAGCALFKVMDDVVWIYLIAPIFNKFESLSPGSLRDRIFAAVEKAGFRLSGVYVMDAGRRSSHSNAYCCGLGRTKRVVLFDTLLEKHTDDEVLAILAHELGHLKHKDIAKDHLAGIAVSVVAISAMFYIASNPSVYRAFGFTFVTPENMGYWYCFGFSLAGKLLSALTWASAPMFNWISRRREYAADAYAAETVSKIAIQDALVRLYAENLSGLYTHPAYTFWHFNHPDLIARVEAVEDISGKNGGEV